jgi:hypothetical protein
MTDRNKALIWAAMILATAFLARTLGFDTDVSFALVMGLVGAAAATLSVKPSRCSV